MTKLEIVLPDAAAPVANYVAFTRHGAILTVSGQLPLVSGALSCVGRLGAEITVEAGVQAARVCFLNLVAQVHAATGDLEHVRVLRLGGFIACTSDFVRHAEVMNGASDLSVGLFGRHGHHARSTIGVTSLPLGAPVEVEGTFEILL